MRQQVQTSSPTSSGQSTAEGYDARDREHQSEKAPNHFIFFLDLFRINKYFFIYFTWRMSQAILFLIHFAIFFYNNLFTSFSLCCVALCFAVQSGIILCFVLHFIYFFLSPVFGVGGFVVAHFWNSPKIPFKCCTIWHCFFLSF